MNIEQANFDLLLRKAAEFDAFMRTYPYHFNQRLTPFSSYGEPAGAVKIITEGLCTLGGQNQYFTKENLIPANIIKISKFDMLRDARIQSVGVLARDMFMSQFEKKNV